MTAYFVVESSHAGDTLMLSAPGRDQYVVTLVAADLRAHAGVYHYGGDGVDGFFRDLATSWRGWKGEKSWASLESTLGFRATMDRAGHVALWVSLADGTPGRWSVHVMLAVEAGQLERLGDEAEAFARHLHAAV